MKKKKKRKINTNKSLLPLKGALIGHLYVSSLVPGWSRRRGGGEEEEETEEEEEEENGKNRTKLEDKWLPIGGR